MGDKIEAKNRLSKPIILGFIAILMIVFGLALLGLHPASRKILGGFFQKSGTWTNDSENWKRIFGYEKPKHIIVVNSHYWKSPHWTAEYKFYIHILKNDVFKKDLFDSNNLMKILNLNTSSSFDSELFSKRPIWFVQKEIENYEVWGYADEPKGRFLIFIEKDSGDMFFMDKSI